MFEFVTRATRPVRYGIRRTPEQCYQNHMRSAHAGKHDPACMGCRELKQKAEKP